MIKYQKHLEIVKKIKPKIVTSENIESSTKIQREYDIKNRMKKEFKNNETIAERKQFYDKMLRRFDEINRGQQLSVGHSRYWRNLRPLENSPVFEHHSVRNVIRKKEMQSIERDNLMLMSQILSPNNTVNRSQLEKQWQDTFKYKHLVSKSKYFNFDKLVNQEMQHKNSQTSLGNFSRTLSARHPK